MRVCMCIFVMTMITVGSGRIRTGRESVVDDVDDYGNGGMVGDTCGEGVVASVIDLCAIGGWVRNRVIKTGGWRGNSVLVSGCLGNVYGNRQTLKVAATITSAESEKILNLW